MASLSIAQCRQMKTGELNTRQAIKAAQRGLLSLLLFTLSTSIFRTAMVSPAANAVTCSNSRSLTSTNNQSQARHFAVFVWIFICAIAVDVTREERLG